MILVTLACVYFGCWEATKNQGVPDVTNHVYSALVRTHYNPNGLAIVPLVVRIKVYDNYPANPVVRRYYFWLFGYIIKLPFEREFDLIDF